MTTNTPEKAAWTNARHRCHNEHHTDFPNYGGRGITMCWAWLTSYKAFLAYVGERPTPRHSLDRIDNEQGYKPGNVRWATKAEQQNNRRPMPPTGKRGWGEEVLLTYRGETMSMMHWAKRIGMAQPTISKRHRQGRPIEEVLCPHRLPRTRKRT